MVESAWRDGRTTSRRGLLLGGGALALGASGLLGCSTRDFTPIRFRETLSFNIDGRTCTGSSVLEFHSWQQHGNIDGDLSGGGVVGQAIIVDLGKGRYIFGAINRSDLSALAVSGPDGLNATGPNGRVMLRLPNGVVTERWPTLEPDAALFLKFQNQFPESDHSFGDPSLKDAAYEGKIQSVRSQRGAKLLTVDELPLLITFKDIKDPKTAMLVDPHRLDQAFGSGARFDGASVEPVDDSVPITTGITHIIPWTDPSIPRRDDYIMERTTKNPGLPLDWDSLVVGVK